MRASVLRRSASGITVLCVPRAIPLSAMAMNAEPRTASTRGGWPRVKKITPSRAHAAGSTPEGAPCSTRSMRIASAAASSTVHAGFSARAKATPSAAELPRPLPSGISLWSRA